MQPNDDSFVLVSLLIELLLYTNELSLVRLLHLEDLVLQPLYLILHHLKLDLGALVLRGCCRVAIGIRWWRHDFIRGGSCCEGINLNLSDQLLGFLVMLILPQGPFHIRKNLRDQIHYVLGFLAGLVDARLKFLLSFSEQVQKLRILRF